MIRHLRSSQLGLTLTEVTVVGVLASVVMLGLVGFYMGSQGTWMEASAQAITQREATTLVEAIAERAHFATGATVNQAAYQLQFANPDGSKYFFWWEAVGSAPDSLIHEGPDWNVDRGSPITSKCIRFKCTGNQPVNGMLEVDFTLRSAQGDTIRLKTHIAMLNRP